MKKIEVQTRTSAAYDDVRQRVLAGEFPPGSKLTVRVLAEQLGLSSTPVKNALAALEREGFLVAAPNRGYRVPAADESRVGEALDLLAAYDTVAVRQLIGRPDRAAVLDAIARATPSADAPMHLHVRLWEHSGHRLLVAAGETAEGILRVAVADADRLTAAEAATAADHDRLLADLRSGAEDRAAETVRQHFAALRSALLS